MRPLAPLVALGFFLALPARAADPATKRDRLKAVKAAVVVVEVTPAPGQKWRVPAFSVGRGGYFITAWKSLPLPVGAAVTFGLPVEGKVPKAMQGVVMATDEKVGFTLFRANSTDPLPVVPVGDGDKVGELDDLTAFGLTIPTGTSPSGNPQPPGYAVAEQKVSVKGRVLDADKDVSAFELDKPGADGKLVGGGPVVNDAGEVVGILTTHPYGAFAASPAPVLTLRAVGKHLRAKPIIDFDPPEVDPKAKFDPVSLKASVLAGLGKADGFSAEVVVRSGGRERRVPMTSAGDGFEASLALFEKTDGPEVVTAEVLFPDSTPRLPVADRKFTVGGKEVLLSDVTRVRFGKGGGVTTNGGKIDGEVSGLDDLSVRTGGQTFTLKTATARELRVQLPAEPKDAYRLTVVVSRDGKEVGRSEAVRFPKGLAPSGIDGLRLGHFVPPKAAAKPTSYLRWLDLSAPTPELAEYPAEQLGLRFSSRQVVISAYPPGVKPPGPQATFEEFQAAPPLVTAYLANTREKDLTAGTFADSSSALSNTHGQLTVNRGSGLDAGQGKFVVYELEMIRGKGSITKLAADFIFYPGNDRKKPVVGVIRWNSQFE